jgi:hypothetical protein
MCFHIDGDAPTDDAPELTLPDQCPLAMQSSLKTRLLIYKLGRWT